MLHPYSRILCRHVPSVPVNPSLSLYIYISLSLRFYLSFSRCICMHADRYCAAR